MNIVITGTSRGLGLSLVKEFLKIPELSIYALSRNTEKLKDLTKKEFPGKLIPINFDFNNLYINNEIQFLQKDIKIDILINNAGYLINKPFDQFNAEEINEIFRVNMIAPAILIKGLLPFFNKNGAHIVNIGSMGGFQGSEKFPGLSLYSASKGALTILTECLASEYKNTNLKFNCLALGSVQTEMLHNAFPGYKAPVKPDEMAKFVVDFALNGHKYMNGKTIPVALVNP